MSPIIQPELLRALNSGSPAPALQTQAEVEPDSSKPLVPPSSHRSTQVLHPKTFVSSLLVFTGSLLLN